MEGARRCSHQYHRRVHQNAAKKAGASGGTAAHLHHPRRRLRIEGPLMRSLNIRWRLTLWYGCVLAAVLAAFGAATYIAMRYQLLERIDSGLEEELSDVVSEIQRASDRTSLLAWLDRRFGKHAGFDFQITAPGGERLFVNERFAGGQFPIPDQLPAGQSPTITTQAI